MNDTLAQQSLLELLKKSTVDFTLGNRDSYQTLLTSMDDARFVLMGEATHGSLEFYQIRMILSDYLIREKGFHAIAIEGDWTSVYSLNRYLQGEMASEQVNCLLKNFQRFPQWLWNNSLMADFLMKLRQYNDLQTKLIKKIRIYGLDLYCLPSAMEAVIDFLKNTDLKKAEKAIERYGCLDHAALDPMAYGYLTRAKIKKYCDQEVNDQLIEIEQLFLKSKMQQAATREVQFNALQNARVIKNAEHYYRALFETHDLSWNIRDQHMVEILENIITHIEAICCEPAKIIIWAHNSHVGDARATEMHDRGEINLGQLVRERFFETSFLLGFSTYEGTVRAASHWEGDAMQKTLLPAMHGSYESLFHEIGKENFILDLKANAIRDHLSIPQRLQRAVGVIYQPETERTSHYYFSKLPNQFDALIHLDTTQAL